MSAIQSLTILHHASSTSGSRCAVATTALSMSTAPITPSRRMSARRDRIESGFGLVAHIGVVHTDEVVVVADAHQRDHVRPT